MPRSLSCIVILAATLAARAGELAITPAEQRILELTNDARKEHKLRPLKTSALLFKIAQAHSENMAKQEKMDHFLDGKTPGQRARAGGYVYARIQENIAMGDPQVPLEDLMKAWMASKGHRENILNDVCTEIGLGIAKDKDGKVYYTQMFGKPRK